MAFDETTVGRGQDVVLSFGTKGAEAALNTNGYIKSVDWPEDTADLDASGTGAYEHSKAGQAKVVEITIEAICTSGAAGAANPVASFIAAKRTEGKGLVYGPAGSATGMPKRHFDTNDGSCYVKSISYKSDPKGVVTATIKLRTTGSWTDTVY